MENTVLFIDYTSGNFVVNPKKCPKCPECSKGRGPHCSLFLYKVVGHACAAELEGGAPYSQAAAVWQTFVLANNISTCSLNEGLGDGAERRGRDTIGRNAGKSLPKPISSWAEDRGLATITSLIEVRVVNLVVN